MSGEVFLMGNISVAKAAGVIRVSYPANSTLVIKGTSSGKQFAKDTNTTSSAKAYIFLAPIGNASYTLTATNTAGKIVSKQVYVAKDQVQSIVLAYELVLFDNGDVTSLTGGWKATYSFEDYGSAKIADGLITIQGAMAYGGSVTAYQTLYMTKNKIDFTPYKAFKAHINTVSMNAALLIKTQQTLEGWWDTPLTADTCVGYKKLTTSDAGANASVDISSLTGSYYVGFLVDGNGKIVTPKVWLE